MTVRGRKYRRAVYTWNVKLGGISEIFREYLVFLQWRDCSMTRISAEKRAVCDLRAVSNALVLASYLNPYFLYTRLLELFENQFSFFFFFIFLDFFKYFSSTFYSKKLLITEWKPISTWMKRILVHVDPE